MRAVLLLFVMMASAAVNTAVIPNTTNDASTSQPSAEVQAAQRLHNRIFAAYVIVLILTVLGTYFVWSSGNKVQEAIQHDADVRIEEAKQGIEKLKNDNLVLSGSVAGLQKDATDAKASQQRVEIDLAKQQAKTATAEKDLLELQARMADRTLSAQQQSLLTNQLRPFAGVDVDVLIWGDMAEIEIISQSILKCLIDAGWNVHVGHAGAGAVRGILVGVRPDSDAHFVSAARGLVSGLQSFGLGSAIWDFSKMGTPPITFITSYTGKAPIRLFIGSKASN